MQWPNDVVSLDDSDEVTNDCGAAAEVKGRWDMQRRCLIRVEEGVVKSESENREIMGAKESRIERVQGEGLCGDGRGREWRGSVVESILRGGAKSGPGLVNKKTGESRETVSRKRKNDGM